MHALLDLMRDNEAALYAVSDRCQEMLRDEVSKLKILDPEHGEEELIELVAAALAKLPLPQRKS